MLERLRAILANVRAHSIAALAVAMSAPVWFFVFAFGGAVVFVSGVRSIAGDGYAQIVAGSFCFIAAALIGKGLSNGQ